MKPTPLRVRRPIPLVIALVFFLAGCVTAAVYQGLNVRRLGGADSIGGTAAILSLSLPERGRQVELLADLGLSYVASSSVGNARRIFDYLLELDPLPSADTDTGADAGNEPGMARRIAAGFTGVGRGYARLSEVDAAQQALSRATEAAGLVEAEDVRIDLLLGVVDAAFETDPPITAIVQSAIQDGYIIQDFTLRSSFLLDLVERYRNENLPGNVSALIQQALPAASSIADPWERALSLARIGRAQRRRQEQEGDEASATLDRAVAVVRDAGDMTTAAQALAAQRLVGVLSAVDRRSEALRLIDRIPLPHLRAIAYADLAESYVRGEVRTVAFLMLTRGVRNATSASTALQRAQGHLAIARRYAEIDETDLAVLQLERAQRSAIAAESVNAKVSLLDEIGAAYLRLDRADLAEAIPEQLPGGAVPARLRARIAARLLKEGLRDQAAVQFRAALTLLRADETADSGFAVRMSRMAARLGEVELAVDLAADIEDTAAQARALSGLIEHLPLGYEASPTVRETLTAMRNGI